MSGVAVHPLGLIWYDEDDYLDARATMIDPETLPPTYEAWIRLAVEAESKLIRIGVPVLRARVRSIGFLAWCSDNRARPDLQGRSRFAFDTAHAIFINGLRPPQAA